VLTQVRRLASPDGQASSAASSVATVLGSESAIAGRRHPARRSRAMACGFQTTARRGRSCPVGSHPKPGSVDGPITSFKRVVDPPNKVVYRPNQ
jgi:hypothetical protein